MTIHQDAEIHRTRLQAGDTLDVAPPPGRRTWLHVATGTVTLDGTELRQGDGAWLESRASATLVGVADGDVLRFDVT